MKCKSRSWWVLAVTFLPAAGRGSAQPNQKHQRLSVLNSAVDEKTVVRFFYQPPGDYLHAPLVFRVVEEGNPLLNTAPMRGEGRTAYISLSEMRELVQALARSNLAWPDSVTIELLGSYKKLDLAFIGMEIFVGNSNSTPRAP